MVCIHVCSRRVLIISLHVHRLWVYSSSSAVKQTSETLRKKAGTFVLSLLTSSTVVIIVSKWVAWGKTDFGQSIWLYTGGETTAFAILNCLEYEFLKGFWSKGDSSHFENSPSSQTSRTYSDVVQMNEKFIHNCLPCLLAEMAKVTSSVARPRKCYINRLERYIFNK